MLGMKHHFDISGSIEIREVDIAGVACIYTETYLRFGKFLSQIGNFFIKIGENVYFLHCEQVLLLDPDI